jgi:hypothetical protein
VAVKITRQQVVAGALVLAGFGLTVYLGVLQGATHPPSRATSALLVVLAGIFQFAGAAQFQKIGKADPALARAAVRRIIKMTARTREVRKLTELTYDVGTAAESKKALGRISVELSWLEEGLLSAIDDWNEFHYIALRELIEGIEDDGSD